LNCTGSTRITAGLNRIGVHSSVVQLMIKCLDLLCVQDVEWLKSITTLPILLKGIVTAEDGNKLNLLP
jgi:hypothetical protein